MKLNSFYFKEKHDISFARTSQSQTNCPLVWQGTHLLISHIFTVLPPTLLSPSLAY